MAPTGGSIMRPILSIKVLIHEWRLIDRWEKILGFYLYLYIIFFTYTYISPVSFLTIQVTLGVTSSVLLFFCSIPMHTCTASDAHMEPQGPYICTCVCHTGLFFCFVHIYRIVLWYYIILFVVLCTCFHMYLWYGPSCIDVAICCRTGQDRTGHV